ncbi:MAG: type II toxin-antitoxin system prevent-host-death family antitoxin [Chloroflexi bacterium]|nr:type II toxin-antitoxin system prevent-host-death family antitoxin [Chloroflexota bacterium]
MKTLEMAKATAPLEEYARDVSREPVILTERGKPVAVLVEASFAV